MSRTDLSAGIGSLNIVNKLEAAAGIGISGDGTGTVTITNTGSAGNVGNTYGTFAMDSITTQQYAYTISPNSITYVKTQWFDLVNVTVPVTFRVYSKIDSLNWREVGPMQLYWNPNASNAGDALALREFAIGINEDIRISIQNSIATDDISTIYFRYISEYY